MVDVLPPKSDEDLIRVIHDRYQDMSKTCQKQDLPEDCRVSDPEPQ